MTRKKYVITNPDAPMTWRQSFALYNSVGISFKNYFTKDRKPKKNMPLTKGEACTLIDRSNNGEAYHVRDEAIALGGDVLKRDVAKNHRNDPKPTKEKPAKVQTEATPQDWMTPDNLRALAALLEASEAKPEPKPKPKPKSKAKPAKKPAAKKDAKPAPKAKATKAQELGIDPVDVSSPRVQELLKAFAAN